MANGDTPTPTSGQVTGTPPAGAAGVQAAPVPLAPIPEPPASHEGFLGRLRALDLLLAGLVLAFAFVAASFPASNADLFRHLAAGRLIAQGAYPFGEDPFTFGSEGAYWANHPWLFDLGCYLVYQAGEPGGVLLVVLKAVVVALTAALMLAAARRRGRPLWVPAACVLLAVLALSPGLRLQPAVLSMFLLALVLWLLEGDPRRWWAVPAVCLAWVNLDDWFLLGPAVVALYLLGAWLQQQFPTEAEPEGPAPAPLGRLAVVLALSVAACLVSPYHARGLTLPPLEPL